MTDRMTHIRRIAVAAAAVAAMSCGGVTTSRQEARKQATTKTCDRFEQCMLIGDGAGKSFPTREACELQWESNWETAWPAADCEDKIRESELETCYAAIRATACMGLDIFATLAKCGKMNVCAAPADAGSGG
jgi:hypothetical protein